MLYSVQSLRYVKLVNRAIYDNVLAYTAKYNSLLLGNRCRVQEAQQDAACVGDKLLKPLAWYDKNIPCIRWCGWYG